MRDLVISEKSLKYLERTIVQKEKINIKKGDKGYSEMVKEIMKLIEEEVRCSSNQ